MEQNENDSKKSKHRWIDIILIIIIIILILLLFWLCYQWKNYKRKVLSNSPGDIFEINCECDSNSDDDSATEGENGDSNIEDSEPQQPSDNNNDNNNPDSGEEPIEPSGDGGLEVSDSDIFWQETSKLRIFSNPVYEMDEIIAPGSSNEYRFTIRNSANCNLTYELHFKENNSSDINMKYRIKRNGEYLVSDYVSIKEIATIVNRLSNNQEDSYSLEWKWIESSNDTEVGANVEAFYQLSIEVLGKQVV